MQPLLLGRVVRRTEILGTASPIPKSIELDRSRNRERPVQRIGPGPVGRARAMDPEESFLEIVVGLRLARRETQTEPIQPRCQQPVQLFEDAILPSRIALHELAELTGVRLHAVQRLGCPAS